MSYISSSTTPPTFELVFLDETSTCLGMRREYAYAPRGERVHSEYLRNFGPNRTLLAGVGLEGELPGLLIDGGTTAEVFEYYPEHHLLPALRPGRGLVLDTFSTCEGVLDGASIRSLRGPR